jgi:hypothetical protein
LCTFFFYAAWSVFLQSRLYLFCNHTAIKLQSRTCLFMQLGFFAIAAHQRFATTLSRMFAITYIFTKLQPHQAKTNLVAIWQCHDIELFFELVYCNRTFFTSFLQSQSHCYKGAITLRQDLQSTTFWFATVFFLQSQHISHCKYTAKDVAITCNLTRLQPHQAKTIVAAILQCHGMELFFELVFFYLCFLQLFFLQNHCSKGAITLPQGCNHSHAWFLATTFCWIVAHQRFATTLSRMFAITYIFTKLQPHQAKTNLVAIW